MTRPCVVITYQDGQYVVSDEDGEFALTDSLDGALRYADDLLSGPGTLKPGSLAERTRRYEAEAGQ